MASTSSSGDGATARMSVASQFFTQEEGSGIDSTTTSERVRGRGLRLRLGASLTPAAGPRGLLCRGPVPASRTPGLRTGSSGCAGPAPVGSDTIPGSVGLRQPVWATVGPPTWGTWARVQSAPLPARPQGCRTRGVRARCLRARARCCVEPLLFCCCQHPRRGRRRVIPPGEGGVGVQAPSFEVAGGLLGARDSPAPVPGRSWIC